MKAVNLVGFKKSGKTTLAHAIGQEFKQRKIPCAALKSSSHATLEKGKNDTATLFEVYDQVAALTPAESALFSHLAPGQEGQLLTLLSLLRQSGGHQDTEILVMEGGKNLGWLPRVLLLIDPSEAPDLAPDLALAT